MPVAYREALLLPLRFLLPSRGLSLPLTIELEGQGRRLVLTSDPARYDAALRAPSEHELVLSPREAVVAAMAGELGVLPPGPETWAEHRLLGGVEGRAWRLDLGTSGVGRAVGSREAAERAMADPLDFHSVYWAGDPELCPGHWMLYGWTVARLAVAWRLGPVRVTCGADVAAEGPVAPVAAGRAA